MNDTIAFRVDSSARIGSGHVMRCLVLATAWRDTGVRCVFVCRDLHGHSFAAIRSQAFELVELPAPGRPDPVRAGNEPAHAHWLGCTWQTDAEQTLERTRELRPAVWVIDHYAIDERWENRVVRGSDARLVVIDDLADRRHAAHCLVDQNAGRAAVDYRGLVPPDCRVLAGPSFALLRPEFAALREASLVGRRGRALRRVLVTMGGSDPHGASAAVLRALVVCAMPAETRIVVVLGAAAPSLEAARAQAAAMPWPTQVRVGIDDMALEMLQSDLAIGAAGGTALERCCLGLPSLVVTLADNQRSGADALGGAGAALLLGDVDDIAATLPLRMAEAVRNGVLQRMSEAAVALVDGRGTSRALAEIGAALRPAAGRLRPMTEGDLELVLRWRNHPDVRRFMFSRHEIDWEEHRHWFDRTSRDPERRLLIYEVSQCPLGVVTFAMRDNRAVADWGFYLAPGARPGSGRGLGRAALEYAFQNLDLRCIAGRVAAENERSIRFHRALGFREEEHPDDRTEATTGSQAVVHFGLTATEWSGESKVLQRCRP